MSGLAKIRYYALVRRNFGDVQIYGITTEKRAHWWGRLPDTNEASHGSSRDILSSHQTIEEAQSRLFVMRTIEEQYRALSKISESLWRRLHHIHEEAIRQAATGAVPPPLPVPIVVWPDSCLSARELTTIVRRWLDSDDATHWGDFEKSLDALLTKETRHDRIPEPRTD